MPLPTPPHWLKSPFPYRVLGGGLVEEEVCQCGHRRGKHEDAGAYGRGPCAAWPACVCTRFRFAHFIIGE